jgi:NADP-dependent 3-hydroxy acid dehydrogenase YdfG
MELDLAQKVVAITGASSGIGEATALAAARAGAAVALGARRTDRIEALARRITDEGGRAIAVAVDVGDDEQATAFVRRAHDELGRLDALVNNAGVMLLGPIAGAPTDEWRRMIHANVFGVLYCTHAALPIMLAQDGDPRGHVVNVSSVAGRRATAGSGVYNASKFAVNAFSEALRQEVAESDIRVTLIEPGAVATELISHNRDEVQEAIASRIGTVRPMESEDIANAIIYSLAQPSYVSINEVLVRPTRQVR